MLADRVESLAAWIQELDGRLGAAEAATGDPKTAKELRKAIEALAKHDPKLEERLANQVSVLKDRLAMLAETVATTSAGLAARDGEISGLRRELEAEHARLERIASDLRQAPGGGVAPKEIEELRRAIADLSSKRSRGKRDPADGVPGKLEILEQRLDTLAKTVATATAGLASKDGELATLKRQVDEDDARLAAALAEVRAAVDPAPVAELRLTLKELSSRTTALARGSQQGLGELQSKVESLTAQLATLGQTVAATAGGLASGERNLSALRAAFDEETGRLDSHVASIEQALASVASQLAALGDVADRGSVDALADAQRALAEQLEALAREVQDTGRGYAERELELAALSRRFDEAQAAVEGLVAEVRSEVQALAEAGATDALEARLDGIARQVEELGGRLFRLDEASEGAREESSALEQRVHGVTESLQSVSRRLEELSAAVERSDRAESERELELAALSRRFDEARAQVDALVGDLRRALETMPEPGPDPEQQARLEALADELARQAAAVDAAAASAAAREQEHGALRAELARLATTVEETGRGQAERELELAALSRRFDEAQAAVEGLVAEVRSEVQALAEAGPEPVLVEEIEGLARRVDAIAAEVHSSASREETDRLLGKLLLRLDSVEHAQESLASEITATATEEISARLDEVVRRLERVERAERAAADGADSRVRQELRELELRMEHAEDAARENREAVLTQLERLASRIEWRLQRLEDAIGTTDVVHAPTDGAQVVPIRGSEV